MCEVRNRYQRQLRKIRKELKLCYDCSTKVETGKIRCSSCSEKHNKKNILYYQRNREKLLNYQKEYQRKNYKRKE